jgi:hypothetical protein
MRSFVMAELGPATHVSLTDRAERRGCPGLTSKKARPTRTSRSY